MTVNETNCESIRLLGKGKGGYSWLVRCGEQLFVLKQIHHEPCAYYQFGDKMAAELNDYRRLSEVGVPMPRLIDADPAQERILKEYIEGPTVFDLVRQDALEERYLCQITELCRRLYAANLNIDYFPTNFVVRDGLLYYVDYECNEYSDEWNFENWGRAYWSRTERFLAHLRETE